jgi:hypothetical protein
MRPEENGIHYDLNEKGQLATTHDITFKSNRFPAKRTVQRNEPVGGPYQLVTTMMSDFKFKTNDNAAKVGKIFYFFYKFGYKILFLSKHLPIYFTTFTKALFVRI